MALSKAEETLALQIRAAKIEPPEREHRFHSERRWRFDFAWPDLCFAVEVEGITYASKDGKKQVGRHQQKAGFEADLEKYQAAMLDGWTVYRCSPAMVDQGAALVVIERMLETCRAQLEMMAAS